MHLRRDPDHVKHGEHDLPEEIMVLGRSQHHQRHGDVLLLLVQFIVKVVVRIASSILEGSNSCLALVRGDPISLRVLEEVVIILLVLLHQFLRVIIFIIFGIAYLNIRQVILLDVLSHSIQPLRSMGRVNDRMQHPTPLKFRGRGPQFVEGLRLREVC
jgi:hypothetical protein